MRHIERTRLLVHLVDVSDGSGRPDPVKDVEVINGELESFGAGLEKKPMIMVASKIDVANKDKLAKLKRYCKKQKLELFPISAVTGKGIEELKYAVADKVEEIRGRGSTEYPVPSTESESKKSISAACRRGSRHTQAPWTRGRADILDSGRNSYSSIAALPESLLVFAYSEPGGLD